MRESPDNFKLTIEWVHAIKMFEENVNIFEHCCSSFVDILRERL